jgi:uncharacterized Ntn-hydrolase superfamily protein
MIKQFILSLCLSAISLSVSAQDTFSIVAVDSTTGEVGSAGASCVNLFNTGISDDSFIGQLVPGVGAINTQAYYLPLNQNNATNRMNLGDTPAQIIDWLVQNDIQGTPEFRQYGVAALINGAPEAVGYTGTSTDDYKNHIVGPNYAIQGNILLGQEVLDSMEARFLNEEGDLACKLMAALQGANMVGADTRCASNGTSSLFAFVKVAQPNDSFGNPSFVASVRTQDNAGIEPIDTLQTKFDIVHACGSLGMLEQDNFDELYLFPNPAQNEVMLATISGTKTTGEFRILQLNGTEVLSGNIPSNGKIDVQTLQHGTYLFQLLEEDMEQPKLLLKY